MSSYRPSYSYDDPPPPPPSDMPPLPRGPPPSSAPYQFGVDSYRPDNTNVGARARGEFSFRTSESAPRYPQVSDHYSPAQTNQPVANNRRRANEDGGSGSRNMHRLGNGPYRGRGGRPYQATAERPLLRFERGTTPQQMLGMNDDQAVENRFLDTDDLSDSDDEAMDESESDVDSEAAPLLHTGEATEETKDSQVLTTGDGAAGTQSMCVKYHDKVEDESAPKWSNPEYYTALPPPDESQRKKRDVVKLIRKARVATEKENGVQNQVAANDDFISFNFGDNRDSEESDDSTNSRARGKGVPGAPLGPRAFSHLRNFNAQTSSYPPGTDGTHLSAPIAEPPPSSVTVMQDSSRQTALSDTNGSRKRKRDYINDDDIYHDLPPPPKRKKGKAGFANGHVLEEWEGNQVKNPIPWIISSREPTEHAGFRLHKEICDFYEFVKPQKFEQVIREDLLRRLQKVIQDYDVSCDLRCFGSFAAGLYLPNADMDLVVVSESYLKHGVPTEFQRAHSKHKLANYLERIGIAEKGSMEIISKAKVPLVKFVDRVTSLRVDMSFENDTGLIANDTFDSWKRSFPAMPIIVTVIKQFLMMRGLNEVVNGGLGGFSVTCLVTSLLQNMPRVQTGELKPERHLGEILLEFLDLYGNQLDVSRTGIIMKPPGYFNKQYARASNVNKWDRLAIMDPNQPDNDISGGSKNVMLIFARFSRAHEEILRAMNASNRPSLLDWMLGGNYNTFLWQRQRLRKLYKERYGTFEPEHSNRTLPDYIPHNFPNGVKGHNLEDAAPQTSSADVSGLHISDRSELVFAPKIPAPVTSHSEPNPPLSDRNKISYRHRHLLEVAKAKFDAAVSDLAESKKKAINPAFWQMTTRKVGVEVNKKANIVNAFRSQLFKLEYPEIAATMEIPKKLTKRMHTSMLVEYRAKKRAAQTLTHDLIKNRAEVPKRQRVRKNKARNLKAKEATAPTSGLAGGGSTDNPITID